MLKCRKVTAHALIPNGVSNKDVVLGVVGFTPVKCPGVFVHRTVGYHSRPGSRWSCVHLISNKRIFHDFRAKYNVLNALEHLLEVDWELSEEKLYTQYPKLANQLRALRRTYRNRGNKEPTRLLDDVLEAQPVEAQ